MSTPGEAVQGATAGALQIQQQPTTAADFQSLWDNGAFETPAPAQAKEAPQSAEPKQPRPTQGKPEVKTVEVEQTQTDAQALKAADDEEHPVEQDTPTEQTADEKTYSSLEAFAKEAGVEFESLQGLGVPVKIDGETKVVPLRDVIKSFQLEGHVNNKSIEYSDRS